jgi:hypothetical protein
VSRVFDGGIHVENLDRTIRDLKSLSPELDKELMKELKKAAQPIKKLAKSFIPNEQPLSQWRSTLATYGGSWQNDFEHRSPVLNKWMFTSSYAKAGIKLTTAKKKREGSNRINVLGVINKHSDGAIYELAGYRKNKGRKARDIARGGSDKARARFIRELNRKRENPARVVYKAGKEAGEGTLRDLEKVIDRMAKKVSHGNN